MGEQTVRAFIKAGFVHHYFNYTVMLLMVDH